MAAWVARLWALAGVCLPVLTSTPIKQDVMSKLCRRINTYQLSHHPLRLTLMPMGENYPPDMICDLKLRTEVGKRISIEFRWINISSGGAFCSDYVEVQEESWDVSNSLSGKLCGNKFRQKLITSEHEATISFRSDDSEEGLGFMMYITTIPIDGLPTVPKDSHNTVFIIIAVATSVLFLAVAIGMCCCIYSSRKKQQRRRRRRRSRQQTLQLQMTLELTEGINNPIGPPPTPDVTAPAYSPPCAPPPYSTLPRSHGPPNNADIETGENTKEGEVTPSQPDQPPPYDEHL